MTSKIMKKNFFPLVSVIIPTYNRSKSLGRAIDSVLAQTYKNIEIIVVDDNGADTECQKETERSLQKYIELGQINYIKHDVNRNGSAARNTGFRASKGEYINYLDDDDQFLPKKIEMQVKKLSNDTIDVGATYCNTRSIRNRSISKNKKILDTHFNQEGNLLVEYLCKEVVFNTSSILFRRNIILEMNGFDESFLRHQDYELMTRFFTKYVISCTGSEVLVLYDLTIDRNNTPNVKKFIDIEDKFISSFDDVFAATRCKNKICKHLWFNILLQALLFRQYSYINKIRNRIKEYGRLEVRDCVQVLRSFIIGLFPK